MLQCGGLLFGYDIGATSGALKGLFDPVMSGTDWYNMGAMDRGEIVSLTMVGACIASLVALIGKDRMGRRKCAPSRLQTIVSVCETCSRLLAAC